MYINICRNRCDFIPVSKSDHSVEVNRDGFRKMPEKTKTRSLPMAMTAKSIHIDASRQRKSVADTDVNGQNK